MRHICATKAKKARKIEGLVKEGSGIGATAKPPEPQGKAGVDGEEDHLVAVVLKLVDQSTRLDPLPSRHLETMND
jgi:hypothetical protein